ncbi:cupin domain-containing protein [Cadophora sp. DSE1049]|nr:cupin domain-containing protein [Cadophora sp. DSE1049]
MSEQQTKMADNGLRSIKRIITDHDADGKSTFSKAVPEELKFREVGDGARFGLAYATQQFPVTMTDNADMAVYQDKLVNPPGIVIPGGTVILAVDMNPESTSAMHRTVSLDYGVVLEGEVELVLDSGETKRFQRGDMAIQRGTSHAWRNPSKTAWARMLFIVQEAQPLQVNGKTLTEDYGEGIEGVDPSHK